MKKIWVLCATVCLAAAVAACGSQSSTPPRRPIPERQPPPPKPPPPKATTSAPSEASSATPEATSAPAEAAGATITIANMSFGDPVTVAPGAEVTVKNDDTAEHSVTSDTEGVFDEHVDGGEAGHVHRTDRAR